MSSSGSPRRPPGMAATVAAYFSGLRAFQLIVVADAQLGRASTHPPNLALTAALALGRFRGLAGVG